MTGRRANTSDLKDSIVFVMSKYKNVPMSIQRLSLLISFENNGVTTSWKTVQKHVDKMVKERKLRTVKLPSEEEPITGYQLRN